MMYTIINANHDDPDLDVSVSEIVYMIESKGIDTNQVRIERLNDEPTCERVHQMTSESDLVIYICPLDTDHAMKRLRMFMEKYQDNSHPPIYVIINSNRILSVEEVEELMNEFELFASQHQTNIVDVAYLEDAMEDFM